MLEKMEQINDESQNETKEKSLEIRNLENIIINFQQMTLQENLHIEECIQKYPQLFSHSTYLNNR